MKTVAVLVAIAISSYLVVFVFAFPPREEVVFSERFDCLKNVRIGQRFGERDQEDIDLDLGNHLILKNSDNVIVRIDWTAMKAEFSMVLGATSLVVLLVHVKRNAKQSTA